MNRQWYRLGPGCEEDGLVAATTIVGVREAQTKILKRGFMLPDKTWFEGAPPIIPEEWFKYDGGEDIRDLFLRKEIIVAYTPENYELDFAYEHMFPSLKPAPAPAPTKRVSSRSKSNEAIESVALDDSDDTPIEESEDDNG